MKISDYMRMGYGHGVALSKATGMSPPNLYQYARIQDAGKSLSLEKALLFHETTNGVVSFRECVGEENYKKIRKIMKISEAPSQPWPHNENSDQAVS